MLNLDEPTEGIRDNGIFEKMEGWWMWVESKLVLQLGILILILPLTRILDLEFNTYMSFF